MKHILELLPSECKTQSWHRPGVGLRLTFVGMFTSQSVSVFLSSWKCPTNAIKIAALYAPTSICLFALAISCSLKCEWQFPGSPPFTQARLIAAQQLSTYCMPGTGDATRNKSSLEGEGQGRKSSNLGCWRLLRSHPGAVFPLGGTPNLVRIKEGFSEEASGKA